MPERFYCREAAGGGRLFLPEDEARHLARVRRVAAGEVVEVFDGEGFAIQAEVVEVGKDRVELRAVGPPLPDRVTPFRLTLATAVPKGDRFDWLVEKATELGVDRLVPLLTERSVVDPRSAKLDRVRRAVIEASKQCGRNRLMEVATPVAFEELLGVSAHDVRAIAHPGGPGLVGWPLPVPGGRAWLAVGPEGGFTAGEAAAAAASGWRLVGLGPTLLRTETAALAGCVRLLALGDAAKTTGENGE